MFGVKRRAPESGPFFSSILGHIEQSTRWAHVQSVHACAVQTHFVLLALVQEAGFQKNDKSVDFGTIFGPKVDIWREKWGPKKWSEKECPLRLKFAPINGSGGPWSGGLVCALFEQETVVRAAAEALFEILAGKSGLGSIIIIICSKFLPQKMVWAQLLLLLLLYY